MTQTKYPEVKADDFLEIGEEKKYTEFNYLQKKVEILEEQIEIIKNILKANNLHYFEEIKLSDDIEDQTWRRLE